MLDDSPYVLHEHWHSPRDCWHVVGCPLVVGKADLRGWVQVHKPLRDLRYPGAFLKNADSLSPVLLKHRLM